MNLLQAIIMGIVQGITEFLPVSSSGHLTILKNLFGMKDVKITFDLMLHFGTLVAIFVVYRKDILWLIGSGVGIIRDSALNVMTYFKSVKKGGRKLPYRKVISNQYRKFTWMVIVSTIPTGIIGYTFEKSFYMDNMGLLVPGICLFITAVLLMIADKCPGGSKLPNDVTYTTAFSIGIVQGLATLPGISRSGSTIAACLMSGFDKKFAVKYSFIMSIPAILGAVVLKLGDLSEDTLSKGEMACYGVGTVVSAVVGYFCIRIMLKLVKERKFKYFAYYCIAVGLFSIVAFFVRL